MTSNPSASLSTPAPPNAVLVAAPTYRRLVRHWWRWKVDEAWIAADHVLIVRTRFFNERYLRLYWADIAALLFFPVARNRGITLIGELICLLVAPILLLFANGITSIVAPLNGRVMLPTSRIACSTLVVSSIVLYAIWRSTRRRWNAGLVTLSGQAIIPLAFTRSRSAQYVDQLRQNVEAAQPRAETSVDLLTEQPPSELNPLQNEGADHASLPTAFLGAIIPDKRPIVAMHAAVFLLGIVASALSNITAGSPWYPLYILSAVFFYLGLPALFFPQQGPEFPFPVRCATILTLMTSVGALLGMAAAFLLVGRMVNVSFGGPFFYLVNVLRFVCCLFGIMTLWKYRIDRDSAPLPPQYTNLNR